MKRQGGHRFAAAGVNAAPVITLNGGGPTAERVRRGECHRGHDGHGDRCRQRSADLFDHRRCGSGLLHHQRQHGRSGVHQRCGISEAPADAGANNTYEVIVQASDGTLADAQTITVTVTNVNEAPVITSNGGGASATIAVIENTTAVTTVAASDPDAATTLHYSIVGRRRSRRASRSTRSTGALAFIAAPNFEAPADAGANNTHEVIVQASDGTLADTRRSPSPSPTSTKRRSSRRTAAVLPPPSR